jgi:signal transduction histidine kinase
MEGVRRKVLVVEDDPEVAELLQLQIEHGGYSVPAVVTSGRAALQIISQLSLDLVLMDIRLDGEMDGIEVAERIRQKVDLPVVFLSCYSDTATFQRAKATKPYSYLLKPVDQDDLLTALEVALHRHDGDRRSHFLAQVGTLLDSPLDREQMLTEVVELAVRELADFCVVDLYDDSGAVILSEAAGRSESSDTRRSELLEVPLAARGRRVGRLALRLARVDEREIRLAHELADRAALALENARLYEVAQRAIVARDQVLGFVAHDLGNSVGAVALAARLLRQHVGENGRRDLEIVERACAGMRRLIGDLLDVARIEAGRLAIDRRLIGVAPLVRDAVDGQASVAGAGSVRLEQRVGGELREVWADRGRILQVFENLIGNAMKFTLPGGLVTVEAEASEEDIRFRVSDTGPGVSAEDLPHLFDGFWQVQRNDRRGVGLGLAICKAIVTAHGGRIWAESQPGAGTSIFFTLPATRVA